MTDPSDSVRYTVLSVRAIWAAAAVIVLVGIGMAVWLLLALGGGDDQSRNQLEAIKTAGTVVVGAGGAAGLLLAARRQRTAEIALKQKDREQAHQERVATAAEADAAERRITDLYTKAADQLGSDKAPVRLAGLYALERVAQDNENQRQTIVNVLCAYLRMPYRLPGQPPTDNVDDPTVTRYRERVEEREVRLTAQRLLTEHLRPGPLFWSDIAIDLTGAVLIDFELGTCTMRRANFMAATFYGGAYFSMATFSGRADFWQANFLDEAKFENTEFHENTHFGRSTFHGVASFEGSTFMDTADFQKATFTNDATFRQTTFTCPAGTTDMLGRGDAPYTVFEEAEFTQGMPAEVAQLLSP